MMGVQWEIPKWKFVSGELDVTQVFSHPLNSVETEGGPDRLVTAFICLLFSPVSRRDNRITARDCRKLLLLSCLTGVVGLSGACTGCGTQQ